MDDLLKSKLVDMFSWFHQICQEHGLKYYMLGGTMLGAARHEGFIPWDDDIDIGMPRADYEKLATILSSGNLEKYILETPDTPSEHFFYPFSKLYDSSTTLIENTKYKIKRGIFIDIFPLDGIGDNCEDSKKNFNKLKKKYNFLVSRVTGLRKGRKWYKNMAVIVARLLPSFIVDNKKLLMNVVKLGKKFDFYECNWCGNLFGAWGFKEVMPREIMGTPTLYKFESIYVYGVEDADRYLTRLYGNWRKLPPKEKQITHHDFITLDLSKSYLID